MTSRPGTSTRSAASLAATAAGSAAESLQAAQASACGASRGRCACWQCWHALGVSPKHDCPIAVGNQLTQPCRRLRLAAVFAGCSVSPARPRDVQRAREGDRAQRLCRAARPRQRSAQYSATGQRMPQVHRRKVQRVHGRGAAAGKEPIRVRDGSEECLLARGTDDPLPARRHGTTGAVPFGLRTPLFDTLRLPINCLPAWDQLSQSLPRIQWHDTSALMHCALLPAGCFAGSSERPGLCSPSCWPTRMWRLCRASAAVSFTCSIIDTRTLMSTPA